MIVLLGRWCQSEESGVGMPENFDHWLFQGVLESKNLFPSI